MRGQDGEEGSWRSVHAEGPIVVDVWERLADPAAGRLREVVQAALGEPGALLGGWDVAPLQGGSTRDREVYLLTGAARVDRLRRLCITSPEHPQSQSEVAVPVLGRRGINFVRDYQWSRSGRHTTFTESGGKVTRHVDLPSTSRNIGHIVVHEAMHFYVSDTYHRTAKASPLERQLMEGGAEFLARNVIKQQLAAFPEFEIDYGTYRSEFDYVAEYLVLLRASLSSFKLAYFQGRVDLLGLTPV
jgi:hypothetical protein